MKNYICTGCGHIYCQAMGDPGQGDIPIVPRDTAFEKVPKDWRCPKCGLPKEDFKLCDKECDDEC